MHQTHSQSRQRAAVDNRISDALCLLLKFQACQPCGNLPQVPISCRNKEQECLESFVPHQRLLTDFKLHSTVSVQHRIHTDKGSLKAEVSSMLYWQLTNCHLEKKYIA